jgi:plastocyanin
MTHRQVFSFIFLICVLSLGCNRGSDSRVLPPPLDTPGKNVFDPASATARVSGSILFEGTPPEMPFVKISGNPYCRRNAMGMKSAEVLVTPVGRLQNVIVYVRSGYEGRTYAPPSEPVVLDQEHCVYTPRVFTIMTNQKLKILNSDDTFHNVHATGGAGAAFNVAQASKSPENVQTFTHPELPVPIRCDFHPWMVSYAGVFAHPFHTTSGALGEYELRLPPGKYEIAAWHEKYGESVSTIEVTANSAAELNFTFGPTRTTD